MIIDYETSREERPLEADACVVGAGAAGIAVATELARTCSSVVVLESGGEVEDEGAREDARCRYVGLQDRSEHQGRARALGGATNLWAGQVLPLDDVDFAAREWVPMSGWPMSGTSLQPLYRRAEAFLQLDGASYDARTWPMGSPRPEFSEGTPLVFRYSRFSPTPNLARVYRSALEEAANVTVLLHAAAVHVTLRDGEAAVDYLEVRSPGGKVGEVRAREFVLCCGAIETARLLLASRRQDRRGVGNAHDLVGRYFQEHAHVQLPVVPTSSRRFRAMFNSRRVRGVRHYPKLAAGPAFQAEQGLVNVGADVCYSNPEGSAVDATKRLMRTVRGRRTAGEVVAAVGQVAAHPHQLTAAAYRHLVLGHKASEGGPPSLCIQCETAPRAENRVRLDGRVDRYGVPSAVVEWGLTRLERRSIERFAEQAGRELERSGIGRLDLSSLPLPEDPGRLSDLVAPGHHHMGTTRMHERPDRGVVDPDCRLHGVKNLSIASSSVFPTSGYSNPTLTIVALAFRVADRLGRQLA